MWWLFKNSFFIYYCPVGPISKSPTSLQRYLIQKCLLEATANIGMPNKSRGSFLENTDKAEEECKDGTWQHPRRQASTSPVDPLRLGSDSLHIQSRLWGKCICVWAFQKCFSLTTAFWISWIWALMFSKSDVLGAFLPHGSLKSWGTWYGAQTFHSSERRSSFVIAPSCRSLSWGLGGVFVKTASQPFLPASVWPFYILFMCRNCSAHF